MQIRTVQECIGPEGSVLSSRRILPVVVTRLNRVLKASQAETDERGFTLVEVLVAIAIVSITFLSLAKVLADSRSLGLRAENMSQAISLAQSVLARVGADIPVRASESEGDFLGGFRWRLTIQFYENDDTRSTREDSIGAYRVQADIVWNEGDRRQSYRLSTVRLGPAERIN